MRAAIQIPLVCAALLLCWTSEAAADRAPLPKTSICNKSKIKVYVATATVDTYTGWHLSGWSVIKPASCTDFQSDAYYVRGKRKVLGLSDRTVPGCVTDKKAFSIIMGSWHATKSPAKCKAAHGRVERFTYPKAGRKVRIDVVR